MGSLCRLDLNDPPTAEGGIPQARTILLSMASGLCHNVAEVIDFSPKPRQPHENPQTPRLDQPRTLFLPGRW
jgi:hypothetical protein